MNVAVNLRSRDFFQNAAWRPLALQVHLSSARMPAKSRRLRTRANHRLRQVIVNLSFQRRNHVARAERQPGGEHRAPPAQLHAQIRRVLHQPRMHVDDRRHRHRQPDHLAQARAQPIVDQHACVLRIVLKLDHVVVAIGAAHQMTLRATAHPANVLDRLYWHIWVSISAELCNRSLWLEFLGNGDSARFRR